MATTQTARTDIHRPSAIQPADYYLVGFTYRGGDPWEAMAHAPDRRAFMEHRARTNGHFAQIDRQNGGGCHICGASFAYGAIYYHEATNTYIEIGWICATKMEMDSGEGENFKNWKERIKRGGEALAGKHKAKTTLEAAGLARAWEISEIAYDDTTDRQRWAWTTTCDIVGKLIRYGSISEKQEAFLHKLIENFDRPAPAPEPPGSFIGEPKQRLELDLTLRFTSGYEGYYGWTTVYGFDDQDGNRVIWKTGSGSLYIDAALSTEIEKGDRIRAKATIKEHSEYKGKNQTIITRLALTEAIALAPRAGDCKGHPAGPNDPMGQTTYCDGSCEAK